MLITFATRSAASQFSQSVMSGNPWEWFNSMAPDPNNLAVLFPRNFAEISQYKNIGTTFKPLRKIISSILTTLLVFFWVVPVGFVSSLSNLSTLSSIPGLGFLVSVFNLNETVKGFIQGFLPSLALILFMILLIPIITAIVHIEVNFSEISLKYPGKSPLFGDSQICHV